VNHLSKSESDVCRATGVSAQEFIAARASNASEARADAATDSRLTQAVKDKASTTPAPSTRLTPEELAMCERLGVTPEQYLAAKNDGA
jgi:hypothetical protein